MWPGRHPEKVAPAEDLRSEALVHRTWRAAVGLGSSGILRTRFAWKRLAQLGPFRWSEVAPWRAVRVAIGVVVPLALGGALGHVDYGAFAALGALPAGFASFQGESRSRVAAAGLASVGMALSTFVGATIAATEHWLLIPVVALWGYITGLSVCLGPWPSVAILQWSVALLIAVGLPFNPGEASVRACLVLAGGLFQAGLVAGTWAVRRGSKERTALAVSYTALAAYASGLAAGKLEAPSPAAFPAGAALEDPNPLLPPATRLIFVDLLEQAERVRASLAALAVEADHVAASNQGELRALMGDAATALALIADALTAPRAGRLSRLRKLRKRLTRRSVTPAARWRWAGEALLGQLRAAGRIVAYLDGIRPQELGDTTASLRPMARNDGILARIVTALRANLTTTSEAGRHALRLAVAAALAEAIVEAVGFNQGRWATLTVFIVLRPDYASTLYRGAQRGVGTAIGAGLGAVAALAHPGLEGQLVAASLCVTAAYALFDVNYLLFSVFLTAFIVVLLNILGMSAVATAEARFFETFIGAAIGLAAYIVWPTWLGVTAQEKFADLLVAHGDYAAGLLQALAHPDSGGASRLRALQAAARLLELWALRKWRNPGLRP